MSNQNGTASLSYLAWDGTQGASGKSYTIAATGVATAFSAAETTATLAVHAINRTPTWSETSAVFTPILPNSTPSGDQAGNIFGAFNDLDGNPLGIAVIGATGTTSGTWEYSLDAVSWTSFGSTTTTFKASSASNALLLTAGDWIQFVPNNNFVGASALTVNA